MRSSVVERKKLHGVVEITGRWIARLDCVFICSRLH